MKTLHTPFIRRAAVFAAGAALATAGCVSREAPSTDARIASASTAMSVACEPTQRAVVHPAVVNGVTVSQVECVTAGVTAPAAVGTSGFETVSYVPQPTPAPAVAYQQPRVVYDTPRVVPATYTVPAPRRTVSEPLQRYERRHATRSVKKSAIIIGSSAGAGAGLGAVIGGKKGAAIGALLGGGGATLWDQITRHKQHQ